MKTYRIQTHCIPRLKKSRHAFDILVPAVLFLLGLTACSSTPPQRDWQLNAQGAIERSIEAYLTGNSRVEAQEFARAKSEIARTGRADLLARVELMRCAALMASLVQEPCEGFEKLRADAAEPERVYADYLRGQIQAKDVALLPLQHRAVAKARGDENVSQLLTAIKDPLSKLVAAGVLFLRSEASPTVLALATETASSQGWRRPLLTWLGVQLIRAEKANDSIEIDRLRRRILLVQGEAAAKN